MKTLLEWTGSVVEDSEDLPLLMLPFSAEDPDEFGSSMIKTYGAVQKVLIKHEVVDFVPGQTYKLVGYAWGYADSAESRPKLQVLFWKNGELIASPTLYTLPVAAGEGDIDAFAVAFETPADADRMRIDIRHWGCQGTAESHWARLSFAEEGDVVSHPPLTNEPEEPAPPTDDGEESEPAPPVVVTSHPVLESLTVRAPFGAAPLWVEVVDSADASRRRLFQLDLSFRFEPTE